MNLINRFYDVDAGSIYFDGKRHSDYDLDSLRSKVGIILQDSVFFCRTIQTISVWCTRCQSGNGWGAAKGNPFTTISKVYLINRYPYRLLTDISTGQKQLISIARTQEADPSSHLDKQPKRRCIDEAKFSMPWKAVVQARTSFVVAHRLKTILNANQIIVLKDGESH